MSAPETATTQTCYRHPSRETGVSCSSCERPICTDCMTTTPVGIRCPECAKQKTQIKTLRSMSSDPRVTPLLIGACVIAALGSGSLGFGGGGNELFQRGALLGFGLDASGAVGVSAGEYWRLVTSGFLHGGIIHLLFNMYLLYLLGNMLEPTLGNVRFAALYFTALLAGSLGALIQTPNGLTVGASGAVFGLMGAALIEQRRRGISPLQSDIGGLLVLNLVFSFVLPNVSWGGHIGGLIGGALAALALEVGRRRGVPRWAGLALCAVIAAACVAGAIAISDAPGVTS